MLRARMTKEKSPAAPEVPPQEKERRPGRSGQGTASLLTQMNEETRVDQLVNRERSDAGDRPSQ